jgi:hypothetical protein
VFIMGAVLPGTVPRDRLAFTRWSVPLSVRHPSYTHGL